MNIELTNTLGFAANIMSNVAFLPQIVKSYRSKRVEDLSIGMVALLFITQLCWIGYAIPLHAEQLWISSSIEIGLLSPIILIWLRYTTHYNTRRTLWFMSQKLIYVRNKIFTRYNNTNRIPL